jgi:hypothetical protein
LVVGSSLIGVIPAQAECPEGKSEVQLTTPNGRQKAICVPDDALPGIENAAEHSDGTIIPSSCPCWDETDIQYYLDNKILAYCEYDSALALLTCNDYDKLEVLVARKDVSCENYVTQVTHDRLLTEQWNTCYKLVEDLIVD